jgi:hypothetical protein
MGDSINSNFSNSGAKYEFNQQGKKSEGEVDSSGGSLKWELKERQEDGTLIFGVSTTGSNKPVINLTFDPTVSVETALKTIFALGIQYADCKDDDAIMERKNSFLEGGTFVNIAIDSGPKNSPLVEGVLNIFQPFASSNDSSCLRIMTYETGPDGKVSEKAHLAVELDFNSGKFRRYEEKHHVIGERGYDTAEVTTTANAMKNRMSDVHNIANEVLDHISRSVSYTIADNGQEAEITTNNNEAEIESNKPAIDHNTLEFSLEEEDSVLFSLTENKGLSIADIQLKLNKDPTYQALLDTFNEPLEPESRKKAVDNLLAPYEEKDTATKSLKDALNDKNTTSGYALDLCSKANLKLKLPAALTIGAKKADWKEANIDEFTEQFLSKEFADLEVTALKENLKKATSYDEAFAQIDEFKEAHQEGLQETELNERLEKAFEDPSKDLADKKRAIGTVLEESGTFNSSTIEDILNEVKQDTNLGSLKDIIKKEDGPDARVEIYTASPQEVLEIERNKASSTSASSPPARKEAIPEPTSSYKDLKDNWDDKEERGKILERILMPYGDTEDLLEKVKNASSSEDGIKLLESHRKDINKKIEEAQVATAEPNLSPKQRKVAILAKELEKTLEIYQHAAFPDWSSAIKKRSKFGIFSNTTSGVLEAVGKRPGEIQKLYSKMCALTNGINNLNEGSKTPKLSLPPKHNSFATVDELMEGEVQFSETEIKFAQAKILRKSIKALEEEIGGITNPKISDDRIQSLHSQHSSKVAEYKNLLGEKRESWRSNSGLYRPMILPEKLTANFDNLESEANHSAQSRAHGRKRQKLKEAFSGFSEFAGNAERAAASFGNALIDPIGVYKGNKEGISNFIKEPVITAKRTLTTPLRGRKALKQLRKLETEYKRKHDLVNSLSEGIATLQEEEVSPEEIDTFMDKMQKVYCEMYGEEAGKSALKTNFENKLTLEGWKKVEDGEGLGVKEYIKQFREENKERLEDSKQRNDFLKAIKEDIEGDFNANIFPRLSTNIKHLSRKINYFVYEKRRFPFESGIWSRKSKKRADQWVANCQHHQFTINEYTEEHVHSTNRELATRLCQEDLGLSPYGLMQMNLDQEPLSDLAAQSKEFDSMSALVGEGLPQVNLALRDYFQDKHGLPKLGDDGQPIAGYDEVKDYLKRFNPSDGTVADPKIPPLPEETGKAKKQLLKILEMSSTDLRLSKDLPHIENLYKKFQDLIPNYNNSKEKEEAINNLGKLRENVQDAMRRVTKDSVQAKLLRKLEEHINAFISYKGGFKEEEFLGEAASLENLDRSSFEIQ